MANRPIPIPSPAAESADDDIRRIGLVFLSVLALVVGIVTGFGAVGFRDLIGLIHNGLFLGQFAVRYDANLFTPPSPWGAFVILVPVIGALAVTFLEVMDTDVVPGLGRDQLRHLSRQARAPRPNAPCRGFRRQPHHRRVPRQHGAAACVGGSAIHRHFG